MTWYGSPASDEGASELVRADLVQVKRIALAVVAQQCAYMVRSDPTSDGRAICSALLRRPGTAESSSAATAVATTRCNSSGYACRSADRLGVR